MIVIEEIKTRNGKTPTRQTLIGRATNRAMRELRRRHYSEYYKLYNDELEKLGVHTMPTSGQMKSKQIVALTSEVEKLKQLLIQNNIKIENNLS